MFPKLFANATTNYPGDSHYLRAGIYHPQLSISQCITRELTNKPTLRLQLPSSALSGPGISGEVCVDTCKNGEDEGVAIS